MEDDFAQFFTRPQSQDKTSDFSEFFTSESIPVDSKTNKPTLVGGVIRDIARTPTRLLQNVRALGQTIQGVPEEEIIRGRFSPYLQEQVTPLRATDEGAFGQSVGMGLEMASYLPFARGLGALPQTSLLGKVGQGALTLGKEGLAQGVLFGAGKSIQEEKPLGEILVDSALGGAFGFAGGAVLGAGGAGVVSAGRRFTQTGQIKALENTYNDFFRGTKRGVKLTERQLSKNQDISGFLSKNVDRFGFPVVENGKLNARDVIENIRTDAFKIDSDVLNPLLRSTGEVADMTEILGRVEKIIKNTPTITQKGLTSSSIAKAQSVFQDYTSTFGREVPLELLNRIKSTNWSIRFPKISGEAETIAGETANAIGRAIKEYIEETTSKYFPGRANPIKEVNEILGKHYSAAKFLEEFEGNVVGGGRFSRWFTRLIGSIVGSKGGPLGSVVGAITADQLAEMLQKNYFSDALRRAILKTYQSQSPEILKEAQRLIIQNINRRALPSPTGKPTGRLGKLDIQRATGEQIDVFPKEGGQLDFIGARKVIVPKERVSPQVKKLVENKEELVEKIIDSGFPVNKSMAVVAGLEVDEEGNLTFNEEKAGLALALVFGGAKFLETKAGKKVLKEVTDYVEDFIENPRLGLSIEDVSKKGDLDSFLKSWTQREVGERAVKLSDDALTQLEKEASKYKPTKPVKLYRGTSKSEGTLDNQPSSWTYDKEVAKMHAEEKGGKVVSKTFTPDEILLDTGELPYDLSRKYGIIDEEEEVIVKGLKKNELTTVFRGQDEPTFSLEPRKNKAHNMAGVSFAKNKETAEVYSLSGQGLNPTVIEGTIPTSKIMTFDDFSPRMRERFKKEIARMDDDDIVSGELIENIMDEAIPTAKALGKEAVDMSGFTRGLVDEIRIIDSAPSFKLISKTDRSDLLERFKARSKIEKRTNLKKGFSTKEGVVLGGLATAGMVAGFIKGEPIEYTSRGEVKTKTETFNVEKILDAMSMQESKGDVNAVGDRNLLNKAYGEFQVRLPALKDVQEFYPQYRGKLPENLTPEENREVARLYLSEVGPKRLRGHIKNQKERDSSFDYELTNQDIINSYNVGPKNYFYNYILKNDQDKADYFHKVSQYLSD